MSDTPMHHWPDGQVRPEVPYRCGAFLTGSGEQCTKLSDHDLGHRFPSDDSAPATSARPTYKRAPSPDEFCENCCFPRTAHRGPMDSCPVPAAPATTASGEIVIIARGARAVAEDSSGHFDALGDILELLGESREPAPATPAATPASEGTPEECAALIQAKDATIRRLVHEIDDLARQHIPDFHFLDYRVSRFWTCEASPIGMCVFKLDEVRGGLIEQECRYCGGPTERK